MHSILSQNAWTRRQFWAYNICEKSRRQEEKHVQVYGHLVYADAFLPGWRRTLSPTAACSVPPMQALEEILFSEAQ